MAQLPRDHFNLETGAFFPPSRQTSASPSLFSTPSLPDSKPPAVYLGLYDGVDDTLLGASEPWSAGASLHREILEAPTLLDSAKNDLQMGRSAVTNHLHGSLGDAQQVQDWSPFGFTQPFPPVSTALRLGKLALKVDVVPFGAHVNPLSPGQQSPPVPKYCESPGLLELVRSGAAWDVQRVIPDTGRVQSGDDAAAGGHLGLGTLHESPPSWDRSRTAPDR